MDSSDSHDETLEGSPPDLAIPVRSIAEEYEWLFR